MFNGELLHCGVERIRLLFRFPEAPELMLVNCHYGAPHCHCALSRHIQEDLEHIASLGAQIVSVCVQESQLTGWRQQRLHNFVNMAHAYGMNVHAVPNRWAGLVGGWLDGLSVFALENTDALPRNRDGSVRVTGDGQCCAQHPKTRSHIRQHLELMFTKYEFDGVVWDEPHGTRVCYCEHCRRACGGEPTSEWQCGQMAALLDEMSHLAKSLRPGTVVSLLAQPSDETLMKSLLQTKHIDYLGSAGHVRGENGATRRINGAIFQAHAAFYPMLREAGRRTIFLMEGQKRRDEDLDDYLANVDKAFALPMEQLMFYYSAHEMSPAKETLFNEATWRAVARLKADEGRI